MIMPLSDPAPRFRQIANLLRDRIADGTYQRGARMPSEADLAKELGVSQPTVNRAMTILRSEGLVYSAPGQGTRVHQIVPILRSAMARYGRQARERNDGRGAFHGEIVERGYEPRSDLVQVERVTPPPSVAEALGLPPGEPNTLIRKRHMFADGVPVQLASSYISWEVAEGTPLAETDSGPGGIISRFAEMGREQVKIRETVSVRRPTEEEQEFLRLADEHYLIEIFHVAYTAEAEPVEVCVHSLPSHQWYLDYEWTIDDDFPESSAPEPQPVVATIVTSDEGVLVGKRNDGKPPWTFIAGEIEPGESPADAAVREVKEETGCLVKPGPIIGRRVHPATGRSMIYMAATPTHGTKVFVGDSEELAEVRWVGLNEAVRLLPGMYEPVRDHLAETLGGDQGGQRH